MAKIIQLKKVPDEQNLKRMLSDLSDMRPRTSALMSLLDVLQAGIATARSKGVEWEDIAKYVSKETETEINPDTIAQSYAAMIREQKNSERAEGELTYTQLKYRYKIAINLLKKSGKTEVT